jgi:hypothetical protein
VENRFHQTSLTMRVHSFVTILLGSIRLLPIPVRAQQVLDILRPDFLDDVSYIHYSSMIRTILDSDNNRYLDLDKTGTSDLSDGQLISIAFKAFEEMENATGVAAAEKPGAMIALQTKGEIYLSSSIKNNDHGFILQFPDSHASIALERCSVIAAEEHDGLGPRENGGEHRIGGNCGEPGAVHLFYRHHPGAGSGPLPQPSRLVAVTRGKTSRVLKVIDPCDRYQSNDPDEASDDLRVWGCAKFVKEVNVRAIARTTPKEEIPKGWIFITDTACL